MCYNFMTGIFPAQSLPLEANWYSDRLYNTWTTHHHQRAFINGTSLLYTLIVCGQQTPRSSGRSLTAMESGPERSTCKAGLVISTCRLSDGITLFFRIAYASDRSENDIEIIKRSIRGLHA